MHNATIRLELPADLTHSVMLMELLVVGEGEGSKDNQTRKFKPLLYLISKKKKNIDRKYEK